MKTTCKKKEENLRDVHRPAKKATGNDQTNLLVRHRDAWDSVLHHARTTGCRSGGCKGGMLVGGGTCFFLFLNCCCLVLWGYTFFSFREFFCLAFRVFVCFSIFWDKWAVIFTLKVEKRMTMTMMMHQPRSELGSPQRGECLLTPMLLIYWIGN